MDDVELILERFPGLNGKDGVVASLIFHFDRWYDARSLDYETRSQTLVGYVGGVLDGRNIELPADAF
jgi:hypothetical protein